MVLAPIERANIGLHIDTENKTLETVSRTIYWRNLEAERKAYKAKVRL